MSLPYYKQRFSNAATNIGSLNAQKDPTTVRLTVTCDFEQGSVVCDHTLSKSGTVSLTTGTVVTLTAMPSEGYVFDHWDGISGDAKKQPVITEQIDTDLSISAVFAKEDVTPTGGNGGNAHNFTYLDFNPDNATLTGKAKAFLKKWWWAVAIVAFVVYKEWKGGEQ